MHIKQIVIFLGLLSKQLELSFLINNAKLELIILFSGLLWLMSPYTLPLIQTGWLIRSPTYQHLM